jgi:hypothetical protein
VLSLLPRPSTGRHRGGPRRGGRCRPSEIGYAEPRGSESAEGDPSDDPMVGTPSSDRQSPAGSSTAVQSVHPRLDQLLQPLSISRRWLRRRVDVFLVRWARRKFKRLRWRPRGAREWLERVHAIADYSLDRRNMPTPPLSLKMLLATTPCATKMRRIQSTMVVLPTRGRRL